MGNSDCNLEYRKYTSKSEADKAINSLKGILLGIKADNRVSKTELSELSCWCSNHQEIIRRNPFKEFMSIIHDGIKHNRIDIDDIEDMYWLCQKYEHDSIYYDAVTSDLQILQGFCHGIMSDGIIEDDEVIALEKWMNANNHLRSYYPYDEIFCLVNSIMSDGVITDEEKERLMAFFSDFVNIHDEDIARNIDNKISHMDIKGICTFDPEININGSTFCFTGLGKRASRSDFETFVNSKGGIYHNSVVQKTNYLVIGETDNPCWAFACYGRKVEKAINLRKKGSNIALIHEFDFWDAVE